MIDSFGQEGLFELRVERAGKKQLIPTLTGGNYFGTYSMRLLFGNTWSFHFNERHFASNHLFANRNEDTRIGPQA